MPEQVTSEKSSGPSRLSSFFDWIYQRIVYPYLGAIAIGAAALIWSTDSIFRFPAAQKLDPLVIVWLSHVLGLAILFATIPFWPQKNRLEVFQFQKNDLWLLLAIGFGGSALATVLYTWSFEDAGLSTSILIQKLKPVVVVIFAQWWLKERFKRNFFPWSIVALFSAVILSFPDLNFTFVAQARAEHALGIAAAFGSMLIWGLSMIAGRALMLRHDPMYAVFWRWILATVGLSLFILWGDVTVPWAQVFMPEVMGSLIVMSTLLGVFAVWIYYHGIKRLPASLATFVELIYPLGGVIVSYQFFDEHLSSMQMLAGLLLLVSVFLMVIPQRRRQFSASRTLSASSAS